MDAYGSMPWIAPMPGAFGVFPDYPAMPAYNPHMPLPVGYPAPAFGQPVAASTVRPTRRINAVSQ